MSEDMLVAAYVLSFPLTAIFWVVWFLLWRRERQRKAAEANGANPENMMQS